MALDIHIGDKVTFKRYDMSLTGTITKIWDKVPKVMIDGIHHVDISKIIKIHKRY